MNAWQLCGMLGGVILVRVLLQALNRWLERRAQDQVDLERRAQAPPEVWDVLAAANAITREAAGAAG